MTAEDVERIELDRKKSKLSIVMMTIAFLFQFAATIGWAVNLNDTVDTQGDQVEKLIEKQERMEERWIQTNEKIHNLQIKLLESINVIKSDVHVIARQRRMTSDGRN